MQSTRAIIQPQLLFSHSVFFGHALSVGIIAFPSYDNCYGSTFPYDFDLPLSDVLRLCPGDQASVICRVANQASVLLGPGAVAISFPFHMWFVDCLSHLDDTDSILLKRSVLSLAPV